MAECELFGRSFTLKDSYIRNNIMKRRGGEASDKAEEEFNEWYKRCLGIETVIKKYNDVAFDLINKYALLPLYNMLETLEIYDVSFEEYVDECFDLTRISDANFYIDAEIEGIKNDKKEMMEYRALRKN